MRAMSGWTLAADRAKLTMSGEQYDQGGIHNFSFVILSPQDISEWIAGYDVTVSVEELTKPTPQTVEVVYTLLIELYKNITTEDQENTKVKMLEHQDNQVSVVGCRMCV
jgi:hypothetical protein